MAGFDSVADLLMLLLHCITDQELIWLVCCPQFGLLACSGTWCIAYSTAVTSTELVYCSETGFGTVPGPGLLGHV